METTISEPVNSEAEITEELLTIMSVAIAAYLGKNVRICRARFISDSFKYEPKISGKMVFMIIGNL